MVHMGSRWGPGGGKGQARVVDSSTKPTGVGRKIAGDQLLEEADLKYRRWWAE